MKPVAAYIAEEADRALTVAMRLAALLGLVMATGLGGLYLATHDRWFVLPGLYAVLCGAYATAMSFAASRGGLRGKGGALLLLGAVSLPTVFYLVARLYGSDVMASYVTGPVSYLYAFLLVFVGFRFEPRLSAALGIAAGLEFTGIQLWARFDLARIDFTPLPLLGRDLLDPVVCCLRGVVVANVGLAAGAMSAIGRRLLERVAREAEDRRLLDQTFGEYVSPEVREAILQHKRHPTSRRKPVALLFSDLRGFSTLSEDRDPAEVVTTLNAYFERMVRAISRERGVVDKFIGDAVMATFDGVAPLDDPASAALRAARAMRAELAALNAEREAVGAPRLDNGIGLHLGEVLIGPIGGAGRSEFTVIGDAVNVASRLESLTKEHGTPILLSDSIHDALSDAERETLRSLGEVVVKGRKRATRIYAAT